MHVAIVVKGYLIIIVMAPMVNFMKSCLGLGHSGMDEREFVTFVPSFASCGLAGSHLSVLARAPAFNSRALALGSWYYFG